MHSMPRDATAPRPPPPRRTVRADPAYRLSSTDESVLVPPQQWPGWREVARLIGLTSAFPEYASPHQPLSVDWVIGQVHAIQQAQLAKYRLAWDAALARAQDDQERDALEQLRPPQEEALRTVLEATAAALPPAVADAPVHGQQPEAVVLPDPGA